MSSNRIRHPDEAKGPDGSKTTKTHQCDIKNGGCSQICGREGNKAICSCKEGQRLMKDKKSCQKQFDACCKKDDPRCFKYNGTKSTTCNHRKCQAWNQQWPHKHDQTKDRFDAGGFETNYCRNPDGHQRGAWCYTMDGDKRWEYCCIPTCPGPKKTWRDDGNCGKHFPINGKPAECDPNGERPCCSDTSNFAGWCGHQFDHCRCKDCINYGMKDCKKGEIKKMGGNLDCKCNADGGEWLCYWRDLIQDVRPIYKTWHNDSKKTWHDDWKKCGKLFPINGKPAECNPNGGMLCCSEIGYCGSSDLHCNCIGCINYGMKECKEGETTNIGGNVDCKCNADGVTWLCYWGGLIQKAAGYHVGQHVQQNHKFLSQNAQKALCRHQRLSRWPTRST